MRLHNWSIGLAVALFLSSTGQAEERTWAIQSARSPVSFLATGKPGFLKIRGEGAQLHGRAVTKEESIAGEFSVDLSQLTTGIDLRDEHMKERYLLTGTYPAAALTLDPVALARGADTVDSEFTGQLTLKGVTKPIRGRLDVKGLLTAETKGKAEFELKLDDFNVGVPSHLGVTVADTVKVQVEFVAGSQPGTQAAQR